jgi:hypothetical protein
MKKKKERGRTWQWRGEEKGCDYYLESKKQTKYKS